MTKSGSEVDALLKRQQELLKQLRVLILPPALRDSNGGSADLAVHLLDGLMDCITGARSRLQSISPTAGGRGPAVADSCLVTNKDINSSNAGEVGHKRRRNNDKPSRSLITIAPHYDGHHWRKYGQKNINGRDHARSYYRCAYKEQNCLATKTIQQQDHNGTPNCEQETAKYIVVYNDHHTCKNDTIRNGVNKSPSMDLIQSGKMAGAATEFQNMGQGDLDVPALIEVLDNPEFNWNILFESTFSC